MFFKMLKSDNKQKKGLNVILFVFIAVASILVFAGSVQIFSTFTRDKTAKKLCKSSDTMLWTADVGENKEYSAKTAEELLDSEENVIDHSSSVMTVINADTIEYPEFEEKNSYILNSKIHYLVTLPLAHDLVFDLKDKPFSYLTAV